MRLLEVASGTSSVEKTEVVVLVTEELEAEAVEWVVAVAERFRSDYREYFIVGYSKNTNVQFKCKSPVCRSL